MNKALAGIIKAKDFIVGFVKKHLLACILYTVALIATLIFSLVLLGWAREGDIEKTVVIKATSLASITRDEPPEYDTEFIVGQSFDTHGLAIKVGKKRIMLNADDIFDKYVRQPADEKGFLPGTDEYNKLLSSSKYKNAMAQLEKITVNDAFKQAGKTDLQIVYKVSDYESYIVTIPAVVHFVRAVEIEQYPDYIDMTGEEAIVGDGFEMYAVLGSEPSADVFGEAEKTDGGWRIAVGDGMYTQSYVGDPELDGFYTATYYCGDIATEFSFYNAAGRSFIVGSSRDVVEFTADGSEETAPDLTLVVTDRSKSYQENCMGKTSGSYIYSGGKTEIYDFEFELTDKEELFGTKGVIEAKGDGVYTATVEGTVFSAPSDVWQGAVVNGVIYDDSGYKLVINSPKRILDFEYTDSSAFAELNAATSWADGGKTVNASARLALGRDGKWNVSVDYGADGAHETATASGKYATSKTGTTLVADGDPESTLIGLDATRKGDGTGVELSTTISITIGGTEREFSFTGETPLVLAALDGTPKEQTTAIESSSLECYYDFTWTQTVNGGVVASGYWNFDAEDRKMLLTEVTAAPTPVADDGSGDDAATVYATVEYSTARGCYSYSATVEYSDNTLEEPVEILYSAEGERIFPALRLYVSEYDMNPLLGTGNGFSRGLYLFTDTNGETYKINFYLMAVEWTYIPLSSTHNDPDAEPSINDYIWDGVDDPDHWDSFYRGTLYADISLFVRGEGFVTAKFTAVEELWLNALLNM